jgi:hypothetical protein
LNDVASFTCAIVTVPPPEDVGSGEPDVVQPASTRPAAEATATAPRTGRSRFRVIFNVPPVWNRADGTSDDVVSAALDKNDDRDA